MLNTSLCVFPRAGLVRRHINVCHHLFVRLRLSASPPISSCQLDEPRHVSYAKRATPASYTHLAQGTRMLTTIV